MPRQNSSVALHVSNFLFRNCNSEPCDTFYLPLTTTTTTKTLSLFLSLSVSLSLSLSLSLQCQYKVTSPFSIYFLSASPSCITGSNDVEIKVSNSSEMWAKHLNACVVSFVCFPPASLAKVWSSWCVGMKLRLLAHNMGSVSAYLSSSLHMQTGFF